MDKRINDKFDMVDVGTRNNFNRTQDICIDGKKVATPQPTEKTRTVFSLPKMNDNEQNNNAFNASGLRTETNSVNESMTEKSS